MKKTQNENSGSPLTILLAEDDMDDRFFFKRAMNPIHENVNLKTVENGELLMSYLNDKKSVLPDLIFLDLNMPCKNGSECLEEIKADARLKNIPVIIYSTSVHEDVADILYKNGAHYYIRKTSVTQLTDILKTFVKQIAEKKFQRPSRTNFIFQTVSASSKT